MHEDMALLSKQRLIQLLHQRPAFLHMDKLLFCRRQHALRPHHNHVGSHEHPNPLAKLPAMNSNSNWQTALRTAASRASCCRKDSLCIIFNALPKSGLSRRTG